MSAEKKLEISLNLLLMMFTVLANVGVVVWFAAEMRVELNHVREDVNNNSERIMEISKILVKERQ